VERGESVDAKKAIGRLDLIGRTYDQDTAALLASELKAFLLVAQGFAQEAMGVAAQGI